MNIAYILYDGFSNLDFAALVEPVARLAAENPQAGLNWDACAMTSEVFDAQGLHHYPTRMPASLAGYDCVVAPGGPGAVRKAQQGEFTAWLATAAGARQLVGVGDGAQLLAAAGLLSGREASAFPGSGSGLEQGGARPRGDCLGMDGAALIFCDARAALDLGPLLAQRLAGGEGLPLRAISGASGEVQAAARRARVERVTGETAVVVSLNLDGSGRHQIETGLPFLDHMLAQVAVHGLFDLEIQAKGDLQVDPHHTLEDTALALGNAFQQALGERAGIVRMASFETPMDESAARVTLDFSGRPYAVFQGEWTLPMVGGLPNTLFAHFLESFAQAARCNLHAHILYGRDDHHKAEALFKALGRAADAAVRIEPRRAGKIPSSKGVI